MMEKDQFKKMITDAADKLFIQNKQSKRVSTSADGATTIKCSYRGDGGTCCPVGFMMDDESARLADLETNSGVTAIYKKGIWGTELTEYQVGILSRLQATHDKADKVSISFQVQFIEKLRINSLGWVADYIEGNNDGQV
jgi:hypothetical protein